MEEDKIRIEGNKKIALFLGYCYFPWTSGDKPYGWRKPEKTLQQWSRRFPYFLSRRTPELEFDWNWNWLMFCIKELKIRSSSMENSDLKALFSKLGNELLNTNIKNCFNICIEIIVEIEKEENAKTETT